jgi:hypothetical protein
MRNLVLVIISLMGFPAMVGAQTESAWSGRNYFMYGNSFNGSISTPKKATFVLGQDVLWKGLGAGLELRIHPGNEMITCEDEKFCNQTSLSANGSYYFKLRETQTKLEPFVTAGYTWSSSYGPGYSGTQYPNVGGGIHYWFDKDHRGVRIGARLEVRDHFSSRNGAKTHFPEFRIGVTISPSFPHFVAPN